MNPHRIETIGEQRARDRRRAQWVELGFASAILIALATRVLIDYLRTKP